LWRDGVIGLPVHAQNLELG